MTLSHRLAPEIEARRRGCDGSRRRNPGPADFDHARHIRTSHIHRQCPVQGSVNRRCQGQMEMRDRSRRQCQWQSQAALVILVPCGSYARTGDGHTLRTGILKLNRL